MKVTHKQIERAQRQLKDDIELSLARAREKLMKMGYQMDEIDRIIKVFREG